MKRILFCLVPWMALAGAAYGQTRSADVNYTYFDDTPTHGFRVGDECFVSVDDVSHWGWKVDVHKDDADVTAEGTTFTLGLRTISGKTSLPIRAAITKLGGSADWIVNTDTLQVLSPLSSISVNSGHIKLNSPLNVKMKAFVLTDPSRTVIDLYGAKLGSKTSQVLEGGVRVSQFKPSVVRVVIQTSGIGDVSKISTEPTQTADFDLNVTVPPDDNKANQTDDPDKVKTKTTDAGIVDGTAQIGGSATAPAAVINLPLTLENEDEHAAQLNMKFTGSLRGQADFRKPAPDVLEVVLPGVNTDTAPDFKLPTDSLTSVTCRKSLQGTVVAIGLARPFGVEVFTSGQTVSIRLLKPNIGDGKLSGKVIVVDAGHGGHDNGASGGGLHEKDFTLALAKLLCERLTEQGATVIMTRTNDTFIPLMTRSDIANQSHADFFISCHINDTGGDGNMSGGITFHHKGNAISRVLAECIQQQVASVSGIPNLGVWSDGKIYQSGFSVLRNTKTVAVLIEFGFLNNTHDRTIMSTTKFQDAVTKAVVKGLKVYLGDAKTN